MLCDANAAFSEPAGLTLKNVKLKTEALDFFQLPVTVEEAVVGSLHVRVSVLHLEDTPRKHNAESSCPV